MVWCGGWGSVWAHQVSILCVPDREELCLRNKMEREQPRKIAAPALPLPSHGCPGCAHGCGEERPLPKVYVEWH